MAPQPDEQHGSLEDRLELLTDELKSVRRRVTLCLRIAARLQSEAAEQRESEEDTRDHERDRST